MAQSRRDHLAIVDVVFHEKHANALELRQRDRAAGRVAPEDLGCAGGVVQRQANRERRALIRSVAMRVDRSAMHLDEVAGDRKAEAEAALTIGGLAFALAETIEDM